MDKTGHSNNVVPVKSDNSVSSNNIVKLNNNNQAHATKDTNHKDTHKLPDTGESKVEHTTLFGTLIAMLGSAFLLFRRKKTSEDKE
nr:LPXTG cell wall anchor domain-containing protein [Mammaliicoccus sciuri]